MKNFFLSFKFKAIILFFLIFLQLSINSNNVLLAFGKNLSTKNNLSESTTYFNLSSSRDEDLYRIFMTKFKTRGNGQFSQGYSFSIKLDFCDEFILITPHSVIENAYLAWKSRKSNKLEWNEISNYLVGGNVFDKLSLKDTNAYISEIINIKDASSAIPNKNIAAFKLKNTDNLIPYEISNISIQKGDSVYLVANLLKKDSYEDIILKGKCLEKDNALIYFTLDDMSNKNIDYIMGAPILDKEGKLIGMLNSYDKDNILIGITSDHFITFIKDSLN